MKLDEITSKVLDCSVSGYYKWKKQERPIISLLEKYFTKDDLEEFLNTGKIEKFDNINMLHNEIFEANIQRYIQSFTKTWNSLESCHDIFIDFYFSFLIDMRDKKLHSLISYQVLLEEYLHNYLLDMYQNSLNLNYNDMVKEELSLMNDSSLSPDDIKIEADDPFLIKEVYKKLKLINGVARDNIRKHFHIFDDWDKNTLVFLKLSLENNFSNLLDSEDREESIYHIIGLYIYSDESLKYPYLKKDLIHNLCKLVKEQDLNKVSYEEIIEIANNNKENYINHLTQRENIKRPLEY